MFVIVFFFKLELESTKINNLKTVSNEKILKVAFQKYIFLEGGENKYQKMKVIL